MKFGQGYQQRKLITVQINYEMKNLNEEYDYWHKSAYVKECAEDINLCSWHHEAIKLISNIEGKTILEIGCGRGDFSIFLHNQNANVSGCDFSEAAISIAKEKAKLKNLPIKFFVADAQHLPLQDGLYDIIFSCECLEHIPNPQQALNEMYRILKPKGQAVITTENYSNGMIIPWIQSWVTKRPFNSGSIVQPIENFFVYWRVKKMMRKSGFKVEKLTGTHFVFLILPKNRNWIKENIRNKKLRSILKSMARHMSYLLIKNSK